jgi:4-amino-4-deoxy-L-arabinose transferase-like glycosyltransferase
MTQVDPNTTDAWGPGRRRLRGEIVCVALLTAASFLVRFWGLSKMHFWDENSYLQNAEYFCCGKANFLEIDHRPPLLSLFFAGIFRFWNSDYAASAVTALLNALGPAFLYFAGRKLVGRIPAAIAALLLAFCPFFVGVVPIGSGGFETTATGHSLLTDCPALTLILLSFWLLLRALEKQTDLRFVCAGFSLALTVLMRFGSLSSVGILSLLVFVANRRIRAALATAAGFALGLGPYLCWSRLRFGGFLETFRNGWSNFGGPSEPFFFYLQHSGVLLSSLTIAGLAIWVLRRAWDLRETKKPCDRVIRPGNFLGIGQRKWEGFLWLWALAIMLFFSCMSHKELRYAIPVAPPLLLLAGVGLGTLLESRNATMRTVGGMVLGCALFYNFWPVHHCFDTGFIDHAVSEEMTVSEFLKHNFPPSTVLYTNENYPDFAYYTDMPVQALPESSDSWHEALQHLPGDGILIAYKQEGDDYDHGGVDPTHDLLDSNPHFLRLREFPSLVLYEYHAF